MSTSYDDKILQAEQRSAEQEEYEEDKVGVGHDLVTVAVHLISYGLLLFGLIGVWALATNGGGESYLSSDEPTLSAPVAWTLAGVIVLQWALLQGVVLALDYLRSIRRALVRPSDH